MGKGLYATVKVSQKANRLNLYVGDKFLETSVLLDNSITGSFFDWYLAAPWFSGNFKGNIGNMLILGLGGGSQVKNYNEIYKVKHIVGVEIDPLIVEIGKKYFHLNDSNLDIVTGDAISFLPRSKLNYDLIIVDLFKLNIAEPIINLREYCDDLGRALTINGVLFINKLTSDKTNPILLENLSSIFNHVYTFTFRFTTFYIATNAALAPKTKDETEYTFKHCAAFNNKLRFLKYICNNSLKINTTKKGHMLRSLH